MSCISSGNPICSCCKHYDALCCDDCEHFYKLTEEDCERKGLPYNPIGKERMWYFPIEGWNCRNTNDFEFCYKYNNCFEFKKLSSRHFLK